MKFKTNEQLMLYRWHVRFGTNKKALANMIGISNTTVNNVMSLDDRYKFIVIELATLYYQNRGTAIVTKDFPYSLRCVINQVKI